MTHTTALKTLVEKIDAALEKDGDIKAFTGEIETAFKAVLAEPEVLTDAQKDCCPEAYTRHILHLDKNRPYTLMSLVWRPGQGSPIHSHNAWCIVGIIQGELTIETYEQNESGQAERTKSCTAGAGETCVELPHGDDIHRLVNNGDQKAVSLHLYGMDLEKDSCKINEYYEEAA